MTGRARTKLILPVAFAALAIIAIVGFTGWFILQAKHDTDVSLDNAAQSQPAIAKASEATDYASCKSSVGSKLLQTYPEQCVTKSGKSFTATHTPTVQVDAVQAVPFAGLPTELQSVVLANAACASNGQLLNEAGQPDTSKDTYVLNKGAFVGQCQIKALYAYSAGAWKFIARTQSGFDCSVLTQYAVPIDLVKVSVPLGTCTDAAGKSVQYQ